MSARRHSLFLLASFCLWQAGHSNEIFAQESNTSSDDGNVTFALSAAAVELDWIGDVEIANLPPSAKMFMIRDTKGLLAVTRYADAAAAQKAFASSAAGATETTFHGFTSYSRSSGGSLTWLSEALVFSVGSGAGEAETLGDTLAKAAVESNLIREPKTADSVVPGVASIPMITSNVPKIPKTDPITPPEPDPGQFFAGGNFESGMPLEPEGGILTKDPVNPVNQVVAITRDDYFEQTMSIPADVNSIRVSLRALIPPSIQLESFEGGQPAPGVKIRVRAVAANGSSGISDWVLQPATGWQELSTTIKEIGRCREHLSLEASWFAGTIYIDDLEITGLFPEFLSDGMYEHYQTPAQVTYIYVVNPIFSGDNVTRVGSPVINDDKVTIDFDFAGNKENLWFVEKKNDGKTAEVVVGPPNAGGDLYHLKKIGDRWAISGIEEGDGI